ncbi:alpha-hydroxy acid oxidase [Xanthomonas pisi]|uniref:Alpha-hydroxy-acid oxidizing protein n=2 Tax=Xanthomonas pisi TaxID=56457 RepID=A0A2S7D5S6_9XANT|nr:alpha-hydroxy acid oxidase [Xanthomonas pisi]PPU69170.1 alpha-hydroxy-acid oxidizing protein [Xanthomonas pisi]
MQGLFSAMPDSTEESPLVQLEDFKARARTRLPAAVFEYIDGWADNGVTAQANSKDFDRLGLIPRVMQNVSQLDTTTSILGRSSRLPLGFSPSAFHKLAHPLGELATAQAALDNDIVMIVSAMSSISLEEIAAQHPGARLWLHIYLFRDRSVTRHLIRRAEAAGFEAISLGLGCPTVGKRPANLRNRFVLPDGVCAANFLHQASSSFNNPIGSIAGAELDPAADWSDVEALCQETSLPVIGKGILNPQDVERALTAGLRGLMVSNHGGRQLDGSLSSIRILPEIVAAAGGRVPILLDGGVRSGTDILKALALGADTVFLGRPVFWALNVGGAQGVNAMIALLADELERAMQLIGCASITDARAASSTLLRWI